MGRGSAREREAQRERVQHVRQRAGRVERRRPARVSSRAPSSSAIDRRADQQREVRARAALRPVAEEVQPPVLAGVARRSTPPARSGRRTASRSRSRWWKVLKIRICVPGRHARAAPAQLDERLAGEQRRRRPQPHRLAQAGAHVGQPRDVLGAQRRRRRRPPRARASTRSRCAGWQRISASARSTLTLSVSCIANSQCGTCPAGRVSTLLRRLRDQAREAALLGAGDVAASTRLDERLVALRALRRAARWPRTSASPSSR